MTVEEYRERLLNEYKNQRNIDRTKTFNKEELALIDKVYALVIETIELDDINGIKC